MQLRCVRGSGQSWRQWPSPARLDTPAHSGPIDRCPPQILPDTHCEVKPVTPLFLFTRFPDPLVFPCEPSQGLFANSGECTSLGHFLLLLLNQTLLSKTADEALCLTPGKIFHEF